MTLSRSPRVGSHIALLTPYDGGNLGDAAIQDALITNFRTLNPQIRFSGITLNPNRTSMRHQIPCYLLAVTSRPHYRATMPSATVGTACSRAPAATGSENSFFSRLKRRAHSSILLKPIRLLFRFVNEARHIFNSYFLLRDVDLLVIAGGGQLDEEWGGPWGHPYALMKWTVLARLARTGVVFLSVGGCRVVSSITRSFLKLALSLAAYRSYRDQGSRELALTISQHADGPVVPDLAFSFPLHCNLPVIRSHGAPLRVGVSPIAFARPGLWPTERSVVYERYMTEFSGFVASLLRRGMAVILFSSSTPDEQIFQDLRDRVSAQVDNDAFARLSSSEVTTVLELLEIVQSFDFVVASRLHGLLLSFLAGKPSVAISYDRKVRCLMEELEQTQYCLDIQSFTSEQLLEAFLALQTKADLIPLNLKSIFRRYGQLLEDQYSHTNRYLSHISGGVHPYSVHHAPVCEGSSESEQHKIKWPA